MTMAERLTPVEIETASIRAKNWFKSHRILSSGDVQAAATQITAPEPRTIADAMAPNDVRWTPLTGDGSN
jgi:hypothetical protein